MSMSHFSFRGRCVEVAINEVLGCWADFAQIGAVPTPLGLCNDQALLFHQPLHDLLRDGDALTSACHAPKKMNGSTP